MFIRHQKIWITNFLFVIVNTYMRLMATGSDVSDMAYYKNSDVKCDLALVQHNICRINRLKKQSTTTNSSSINKNNLNEKFSQIYSDIGEISKSISSGKSGIIYTVIH